MWVIPNMPVPGSRRVCPTTPIQILRVVSVPRSSCSSAEPSSSWPLSLCLSRARFYFLMQLNLITLGSRYFHGDAAYTAKPQSQAFPGKLRAVTSPQPSFPVFRLQSYSARPELEPYAERRARSGVPTVPSPGGQCSFLLLASEGRSPTGLQPAPPTPRTTGRYYTRRSECNAW